MKTYIKSIIYLKIIKTVTKTSKGISKITELDKGYIIEIPSRFDIRTLLFILGASGFIIYQINNTIFKLIPMMIKSGFTFGSIISLVVMFLIFSGMIFLIINMIMYLFKGKEVILIDGDKMTIRSEGDFFGGKREFDLTEIKNFSSNFQNRRGYYGGMNYNMFGKKNRTGTIKFDYGMKTYRFGIWMEEAEGRYILDLLRAKKLIAA